jgi:hypothetical protein
MSDQDEQASFRHKLAPDSGMEAWAYPSPTIKSGEKEKLSSTLVKGIIPEECNLVK